MLISTFAVLGLQPVSASKPTEQVPSVYYVDGKPYIPMDILQNAPSITQNDNNKTHPIPKQAHLANGSTTIQKLIPDNTKLAKDSKGTMALLSRQGLTINVQADDYMGEDTFERDSLAYISTTIDASGTYLLCHWEARLLRQVICHNIDGTIAESEVRWIATQTLGDDIAWSGPSDWTPTFEQSLTLSELCTTGTWYLNGGSNLGYTNTWENWNRVVVYRIEIKQVGVGQSDGELIGITDFNDEHSIEYDGINPYFGSWAIGHGEMQRYVTQASQYGGLRGNGRIDYANNVVGGQDWNWMYMDGYQQYDTSYMQVHLSTVYNGVGYLQDGFKNQGDLYMFSYVWSGYPSYIWLHEGYSTGTIGISGTTPTWTTGWNIWYGQASWTSQRWSRFTASWITDLDYLTIFQQTPAGRYGSNFSIDSIVEIPTFQEPSAFL